MLSEPDFGPVFRDLRCLSPRISRLRCSNRFWRLFLSSVASARWTSARAPETRSFRFSHISKSASPSSPIHSWPKGCAAKSLGQILPAEECRQEPASVDLVTIAAALHWMDRSRVIAYARELASPGAYGRDLEARYSLAWPRAKIPVDFSPGFCWLERDSAESSAGT